MQSKNYNICRKKVRSSRLNQQGDEVDLNAKTYNDINKNVS